MRLDKWLWAARLFKTRGLAAEEIGRGRIQLNGQAAKPARDIRVGDCLRVRQGPEVRDLVVLGLSALRGPASAAQALYAESADSVTARLKAAESRRLAAEPAASQEQGRPSKRDRRQLASWQRWSASADGLPREPD